MEIFVMLYASSDRISNRELLDLHRLYWTFIAEKGLDYKPDIQYKDGPFADIYSSCFLCEYAGYAHLNHDKEYRGFDSVCWYCPHKTFRKSKEGKGSLCITNPLSIYVRWKNESDIEARRKLAYEIANLELEET